MLGMGVKETRGMGMKGVMEMGVRMMEMIR